VADAGSALQTAVFSALSAAPPIGAPVYDRVPEDAPYPQIEIIGGMSRTWRYAAIWGEQITVEIHVWSRYDGYKEARSLLAAIRQRLDEQDLPMSGVILVDIQYLNEDLMMDVDNMTRHGIVRLTATCVVQH
jgi:hypothetical protein